MKICTICKQKLPKSAFGKDSSLKSGLTAQCRNCRNEAKRTWAMKNPDKVKAYTKEYNELNKEKIQEGNKQRCSEYYYRTHETRLLRKKEYKQTNKHTVNATNARRRARKLLSTPQWVLDSKEELEKIVAIYKEATDLTASTGIKHHVDHIVPLQGKYVSGFHCSSNLQVLTEEENIKKGNSHESDKNFD